MKYIQLVALFVFSSGVFGQSYMNEWIDHSKTYYRFKVGAKGVYRIPKSQLTSLGIGATDAAHFQLWNKGEQVPIYTSVANGTLPDDGFIEFWGQTNNGAWESRLYLRPEFQINPEYSLFTDTSIYFLTVNTQGNNKRLVNVDNDINSTLPAESFFMHRAVLHFGTPGDRRYNQGFAAVVGSEVFSSSYDNGEGHVSPNINPAGCGCPTASPFSNTINNLFVATSSGVDAGIRYTAAGRNLNVRNISISVNNTVLEEREMNYYNSINNNTYVPVPLSLLSSNSAKIDIRNLSTVNADRIVVGLLDLKYPRIFNFGGQTSFEFELPANDAGNKLIIQNFNFGGIAPVLYDLTNGLRITAQIMNGNDLQVVLPPSSTTRKLVLVSVSQPRSVPEIITRRFNDYTQAEFQGNYIIISNPLIYTDNSGVNQVEAYGKYRMSSIGGNYKVIIVDINQLIDQFGWGIKNNPLSIRNFLRFARKNFADKEQYCLLIGKGVAANAARANESRSGIDRLNLVPTFGVPASDVTLAAEEGDLIPRTHIGRLNVINAEEVKEYLDKLKLYEDRQRNKTCSIDEELWKKQVMHIGGADDFLGEQIMYYLREYEKVAEDTLLGANTYTVQKSKSTNIQVLAGEKVRQLFTEGFSMMTYFGHSSAGTLEFNLDNPENYPFSGKFPVFMVNGCNAGNLFMYDEQRLNGNYVLSEKYVVSTPLRGAIAFIASTHLGVVYYLHLYTDEFYRQLTQVSYGKPLGVIMSSLIDTLISRYTVNDFFVRQHVEEIALHGDPALVMYHYEKPDYAIENKNVKITPEFISIAENNYSAKVTINNIGRVSRDSLWVRIEKIRPDNKRDTLFNKNIAYIPNTDSLELLINLLPQDDKGLNKIIVLLDPDNKIDEECETNNQVTKEFFIYEDEIRPVYPYDFSIVNNQNNLTFYASTANPLGEQRTYYFQIDTTIRFNSNLLKELTVYGPGGLVEFRPTITLQENYVYYWRVGVKDELNNKIIWNSHSFIYRSDLSVGYNQSHYYQFTNNTFKDIFLDPLSRQLSFKNVNRKLKIRTGLHPYFGSQSNDVFFDLQQVDGWRCVFNVFSIYVFEPKTLIPWRNTLVGTEGRFGSLSPYCNRRDRNFFEYDMEERNSRNNARIFLEDIVPDSALILVINQGASTGSFDINTSFIEQWMSDTATFGSEKSIYHTLKKNGFTQVDSFTRNLPFAFLYKKGDPQFVRQFMGEKDNDFIDVVLDIPAQLVNGDMETPWFGPMKKWDNFYWDGDYPDGKTAKDSIYFQLIGRRNDGSEVLLRNVYTAKDTTISFIDAQEYPYVKMKLHTQDSVKLTPFQLDHWRLTGIQVPEGALAPSIKFSCPDSVDFGDNLELVIAFKNISEYAFDSLKLKLELTNNQNRKVELELPKKRPLISGDTIIVRHFIDTKALEKKGKEPFAGYNVSGRQNMFLMINPDRDQPEQHTFNNFIYKNIFINKDKEAPWLDVTFDGVHILNKDIVSAKPAIVIKIKDNNKFLTILEQDSVQLSIRFPDQRIVQYRLGSDSARYTSSALSSGINELLIDLLPNLYLDGDYELTVAAKSGNDESDKLFKTYKVNFTVINKPMISNMFNYPNPFTTSTSFVFTLTGSEVPQNLRIQILTISGKIVREITKNELGVIRIGKNITEYKWDGTDQYGNALANGVYLYRVITNLNGKKLDKYEDGDNPTDKYFNNGYGKMYLMR